MTPAEALVLRALLSPPCTVREADDFAGLERLDDEALDEEGGE